MVFQPENGILTWVSPIDMLEWAHHIKTIWETIPELFGTAFVAW
jgi:hypothetical protein